jgi:hypothetical protein
LMMINKAIINSDDLPLYFLVLFMYKITSFVINDRLFFCPLQFVYFLFLLHALSHWLKHLVQCWIEIVMVDLFVLFIISEEKLSFCN